MPSVGYVPVLNRCSIPPQVCTAERPVPGEKHTGIERNVVAEELKNAEEGTTVANGQVKVRTAEHPRHVRQYGAACLRVNECTAVARTPARRIQREYAAAPRRRSRCRCTRHAAPIFDSVFAPVVTVAATRRATSYPRSIPAFRLPPSPSSESGGAQLVTPRIKCVISLLHAHRQVRG